MRKKKIPPLLLCALLLLCGIPGTALPVYAESGNVYTCVINRCYSHPVTGVIEDSGGEASYATGQGMVEGCVYPTGIIEVTASGNYYVTIRMSLMDYTSGHTFWVQNVGDSGWMNTSVGTSKYGSDSNGTTADICIQVPSENCVLRGTMYVEPMGRDVVWYLYPSNYTQGNSTDMTPMFVTESGNASSSESGQTQENAGSSSGGQTQSSGGTDTGSAQTGSGSTGNTSGTASAGNSSLPAISSGTSGSSSASGDGSDGTDSTRPSGSLPTLSDGESSEESSSEETAEDADDTENESEAAPMLQSTLEARDPEENMPDPESTALNGAQGLSLSTAGDASAAEDTQGEAGMRPFGTQLFLNVLSILIGGGILLLIAAIVAKYFIQNAYRWSGGADDDE